MKIDLGPREPAIAIESVDPEMHIICMTDEHGTISILRRMNCKGTRWKFDIISVSGCEIGDCYSGNGNHTNWRELINTIKRPTCEFHAFSTPEQFFKFCVDFVEKKAIVE